MSQVQSLSSGALQCTAPTPDSAGPGVTHARHGEALADVAQRLGTDEPSLRQANPDLPNPDFLLDGQVLNVPGRGDESSPGLPPQVGVAGAMGRETAVQGLMERAYDAGRNAPQEAFDGKVYRAVPEPFTATAYDHTFGKEPNRYRSANERLIYASPDLAAAAREVTPYADKGAPLAGMAVVEGSYKAAPGADGKGGVANVHEGLRKAGLPPEALAEPKGPHQPTRLQQLTGEHPYTLAQQAAKGAADAGASAMRVPSATGAPEQINIIPRNTDPSQLKAQRVLHFDHEGISRGEAPADQVKPMPPNDKPVVDGPLNKNAGNRGEQAANQARATPAEGTLARAGQMANGALEGHPRANSGRYGAAGGAAVSLASDAWHAANGGKVDLAASAGSATVNAGVGYGAARAADALTPRMGLRGAGGAVSGAIESVVSTGTNAQAYRRGEVSAAKATANIAVDTATAVGAGAAGAWAGGAVGTAVFPVVGTAVGAVAGFAVGSVAYLGVQAVAKASGAMDAAKAKLATALEGAEKPLGRALDKVGEGLDKVQGWGQQAWNAVKPW